MAERFQAGDGGNADGGRVKGVPWFDQGLPAKSAESRTSRLITGVQDPLHPINIKHPDQTPIVIVVGVGVDHPLDNRAVSQAQRREDIHDPPGTGPAIDYDVVALVLAVALDPIVRGLDPDAVPMPDIHHRHCQGGLLPLSQPPKQSIDQPPQRGTGGVRLILTDIFSSSSLSIFFVIASILLSQPYYFTIKFNIFYNPFIIQ